MYPHGGWHHTLAIGTTIHQIITVPTLSRRLKLLPPGLAPHTHAHTKLPLQLEMENLHLKSELEAARGLLLVQNKLHAATVAGAAATAAAELDAATAAARKVALEAKAAVKEVKTAQTAELKRREQEAAASIAKQANIYLQKRQELQRQRSEAQAAQNKTESAQRKAVERIRKESAAAAAAQQEVEERACEKISAAARAQLETEAMACQRVAAAEGACAELSGRLTEASKEIQNLRISKGMLASVVEKLRAAARLQAAEPPDDLRRALRREKELRDELGVARVACEEARAGLKAAKESVARRRSCARQDAAVYTEGDEAEAPSPSPQVTLTPVRNSESADATLTARTLEYCRAVVDDCNISFEAASSANALVLHMHMGVEAVPDSRLFSSKTFKRAFDVLGVVDNEIAAEHNRTEKAPHGGGADIGNDGNRAMNMMACSIFNFDIDKPLVHCHALYVTTHPHTDVP